MPTERDDPFTMEVRLCDDNGMVSDERVEPGSPGTVFDPDLTYRKLLNNLRARNGSADTRKPYEGEPFACTGSAHAAGEHVRCTSPAHRMPQFSVMTVRANAAGSNVAVLSPAGSVIVCANGYCHVCGDSLLRTHVGLFCNRCQRGTANTASPATGGRS